MSLITPVEKSREADVVIVGAGPIGLLLAYQLRRFSSPPVTGLSAAVPISVHIIEALPKPAQETFGRAVTIWSRPMEILSQLGLGEDILRHCMAVRSSAAYNAEGEEVFGRGWSFVEKIIDTRFRFASVLRQRFVEDILRAKLRNLGVEVIENHKFLDLEISEDVAVGEKGRVQAKILDTSLGSGNERGYTIGCRYLIGCDGTKTKVRDAANIASDGCRTEDKWVRVDGVLKSTTMPKPLSYGSLESKVYGNVLWIPLDHGATRIGFALKEERRRLYDVVNEEVYVKEALLSIAPFKAEYERVDWASVYSVGQRLAKNFWTGKSVFIAGDAAHSHSSGAGQGLNTGVQDAANLGWKLALVLRGVMKPEILETYEPERRPSASKLIKYDEDISVLISGRLPKGWKGSQDPNDALSEIFRETTGFNTGLNIAYAPNMAIWRDRNASFRSQDFSDQDLSVPTPAIPGYRAPDVTLLRPGLWSPVWLQELTPNLAKFYVLIFTGKSLVSRNSFHNFKSGLGQSYNAGSVLAGNETYAAMTRAWPVEYITILPEKVSNVWIELGGDALGNVYYDDGGSAGRRYGVDKIAGAIFVLRPDGFIGARFPLDPGGLERMMEYLRSLMVQCPFS
ncbi:FAD binding domain-containing protein [Xylariaceae sp. FL0255]|nr:FAD binding domain-containing protein [Xylariaceae sp. FL0255]